MQSFLENLKRCVSWFSASSVTKEFQDICPTRDVFEARWSGLLTAVSDAPSGPLLAAVIGEIGLNSFDHNLGKWRDAPGCWFFYALEAQTVFTVIADRGQGMRSSLQRVRPSLQTDEEALRIAFEIRISGRAPEKRGNGLKFVRSAINSSQTRGLLCHSGTGEIVFGETNYLKNCLKNVSVNGTGVLSVIQWEISR